jgi:hypothetical protein
MGVTAWGTQSTFQEKRKTFEVWKCPDNEAGSTQSEWGDGPVASRIFRPLGWLLTGLRWAAKVVLVAWTSLAIFYSNLPWPNLRLALAIAFAGFAAWVFFRSRGRRMHVALAITILGVIVWWIAIARPSVAGGRRGNAPGLHRWRSHTLHWRPQFPVSKPI